MLLPRGSPNTAARLPAVQRAGTCRAPFLAATCLPGGTRRACFPLPAPQHSSGWTRQRGRNAEFSLLPDPAMARGGRQPPEREQGAAGMGCHRKRGATENGVPPPLLPQLPDEVLSPPRQVGGVDGDEVVGGFALLTLPPSEEEHLGGWWGPCGDGASASPPLSPARRPAVPSCGLAQRVTAMTLHKLWIIFNPPNTSGAVGREGLSPARHQRGSPANVCSSSRVPLTWGISQEELEGRGAAPSRTHHHGGMQAGIPPKP